MTDTVDEPQAHEDIFGQQRWDILRDRARLVHEADPRTRTMVTAEIEIVSDGRAREKSNKFSRRRTAPAKRRNGRFWLFFEV